MRPVRYVICDVFTDTPLEGNQLAVFTDATDLPEAPDGQFYIRDDDRFEQVMAYYWITEAQGPCRGSASEPGRSRAERRVVSFERR